jgi:GNAT superfamily N-acetyltransferase
MQHEDVSLRPADLPGDASALARLNIEYLVWATGRLWDEYQQVMAVPDEAAAAAQVSAFDRPGAGLLVAEDATGLIGMGALRLLEPGIAEVKRMYIQPHLQGYGLGARLLDALLDMARQRLDAKTIRLDTCRFMIGAQRLYESRGFLERAPYQGTEIPDNLRRYWRFYERDAG